jgi:hypothetical protein
MRQFMAVVPVPQIKKNTHTFSSQKLEVFNTLWCCCTVHCAVGWTILSLWLLCHCCVCTNLWNLTQFDCTFNCLLYWYYSILPVAQKKNDNKRELVVAHTYLIFLHNIYIYIYNIKELIIVLFLRGISV